MKLEKLREPFAASDIEWRIQSSGISRSGDRPWGMCLAYVTARAIMDRLDDVCGPGGWRNDFRPAPEGGILCDISIKIDGEWVTKCDGASNTDIEAVKGGLSSAMKRAGSQWGIGRYLYNLEATWAIFEDSGKYKAEIPRKSGKFHKWNPPALPGWALPVGDKPEPKIEYATVAQFDRIFGLAGQLNPGMADDELKQKVEDFGNRCNLPHPKEWTVNNAQLVASKLEKIIQNEAKKQDQDAAEEGYPDA